MIDNNLNLVFCLIGSLILSVLNKEFFESAWVGLFNKLELSTFIYPLGFLISLISFIGYILTFVFAILLIKRNINSK